MNKVTFLLVLTFSFPALGAISPTDIFERRTNCSSLPSLRQNNQAVMDFVKNGSPLELCTSSLKLTQNEISSLPSDAKRKITVFIDDKKLDLSALQNLANAGVNLSISTRFLKRADMEFSNLQYLSQSPNPGKLRIFVDSDNALDMSQLAALATRPIEMHIKLEQSPVKSRSDLIRLSQTLQDRLFIYTDGTTFSESEISQARSLRTNFILAN